MVPKNVYVVITLPYLYYASTMYAHILFSDFTLNGGLLRTGFVNLYFYVEVLASQCMIIFLFDRLRAVELFILETSCRRRKALEKEWHITVVCFRGMYFNWHESVLWRDHFPVATVRRAH